MVDSGSGRFLVTEQRTRPHPGVGAGQTGGFDPVLLSREGGHLAPQSGRRTVKQLARSAYDATGHEKFLDVSSHDLRRFWANYLLVGKGVNLRAVMRLGGWEGSQSIKSYLDRPRDTTVATEMVSAEWA